MNLAPLLLVIAVFGLMWVLILRPQQQRVRHHEALIASLAVGDEVITTGGIFGTIVELGDDVVVMEVADGVHLRVARPAVGQRLSSEQVRRAADDVRPPTRDDLSPPTQDSNP